MKAIVYTKYGSPDVLQLQAISNPAPKEVELLIRIHTASINSRNWRFMRPNPFFIRLVAGIDSSTVLCPTMPEGRAAGRGMHSRLTHRDQPAGVHVDGSPGSSIPVTEMQGGKLGGGLIK